MTDKTITLSDVEREAAKLGITLMPDDYAAAQAVVDARRTELERQAAQEERATNGRAAWVDRFNRLFPRLLSALLAIGDVSLAVAQTVLIAFGVPLILIMLLFVEQSRVFHGIQLFEVSDALAAFAAWALVVLSLVVELLIAHIERRASWSEPPKYAFSLRLLWQRARYVFGAGAGAWQAVQRSPAARFRAVLKAITITILALAVGGSMRPAIESTDGNWLAAALSIFTQSSLLQFVTWLGGLLFAFTAVISAQALARYVSERVAEVVAILARESEGKARDIAAALGMTAAYALAARLKERQKERRDIARAVPAGGGGIAPEGFVLVPLSENSQKISERDTLTPAVRKAVEWLRDNPDATNQTLKALSARSGFSVSTLSRARRRLHHRKVDHEK
ncbi:hypothetical protein FBQ95_05085 [Chloroflexi bacterium CFX3]|nr:hypothetical protein [Chloroflexi bacterium CFX3]